MEGMGTGTDMAMGMVGTEEPDRRNHPRWPFPESTATHT